MIFLVESKFLICTISDIVNIVNNDGQLSRFKSVKKTIRQSFRRKRRTTTLNNEQGVAQVIQDCRPIEREITGKPRNNISTSTLIGGNGSVKMIKFVSGVVCDNLPTDLLLVGTSGSVLHIHSASTNDRCKKLREIRLRHLSSILHADITKNILVIYTEEQIRWYNLQSTSKKARYKCRLTAVEGSRISSVNILNLQNKKRKQSALIKVTYNTFFQL